MGVGLLGWTMVGRARSHDVLDLEPFANARQAVTSEARLTSPPEQSSRLDLQDLKAAMDRLPVEQREVLILVGGEGVAYEEAAVICGCAIGTIKSRVNRARARLAELLGLEEGDLSHDPLAR